MNLQDLNFDAFERLGAISRALDALEVAAGDRVLDVGGHPGLLAAALPHRTIVTIDFPRGGAAGYVQGSGTALPFRNGAFAAVIASDTLEHVPPAGREGFLCELLRVSNRHVLVGGPYARPATLAAEKYVRELVGPGSLSAGWLAEHAEYGLPDLAWVTELFARNGCTVESLPGSELLRWYMLFAAQALADYLPGAAEKLQQFMPRYNREFVSPVLTQVPYRHLVVASKNESAARGALPADEPTVDDELVCAQLATLHQVFRAVKDGVVRLHEASRGGGAEAAYVHQLEKALSANGVPSNGWLGRMRRWFH